MVTRSNPTASRAACQRTVSSGADSGPPRTPVEIVRLVTLARVGGHVPAHLVDQERRGRSGARQVRNRPALARPGLRRSCAGEPWRANRRASPRRRVPTAARPYGRANPRRAHLSIAAWRTRSEEVPRSANRVVPISPYEGTSHEHQPSTVNNRPQRTPPRTAACPGDPLA